MGFKRAHNDDWNSHELEQPLALLIVLLGHLHCALGILLDVFGNPRLVKNRHTKNSQLKQEPAF